MRFWTTDRSYTTFSTGWCVLRSSPRKVQRSLIWVKCVAPVLDTVVAIYNPAGLRSLAP
jgi:hypothetical protein